MEFDLRGKRFGRITVVEKVGYAKNRKQGFLWRCICTCGNDTFRTTAQLFRSVKLKRTPVCRKCSIEAHAQYMKKREKCTLGKRGDCSFSVEFYAAIDVMEILVSEFGPTDEDSFTDEQIDPIFAYKDPVRE